MNRGTKAVGILLFAVAAVMTMTYEAQDEARMRSGPVQAASSGVIPAAHAAAGASASLEQAGKVAGNAKAFSHFRVGNKNVKSIYVDGKVVWVGTSGGVVRYDTATDEYKLFDARSGLLSVGVFFVGKVQGRIAAGTYGGGLSLFDAKTERWENFNVPDGLGDAFVYDVIETPEHDIWIATWSGANRVRGGNFKDRSKWELYTVASTKGGLPNDWVYGLGLGKNGEVWFATEGGLARFRGGKWDNWNHEKGLGAPYAKVKDQIDFKVDPGQASSHHAQQKKEMGLEKVPVAYNPNYIVAMEVAPDGTVWCGTWGGGLAHFDGRAWTNYTVAEGLPSNHVFMLYVDPQSRLWVGTNNGLAEMKGRKFENYTVADGLFSNSVFSMAAAPDGTYWVGSFGGVAHLRDVLKKQ